VSGFWPCKGS